MILFYGYLISEKKLDFDHTVSCFLLLPRCMSVCDQELSITCIAESLSYIREKIPDNAWLDL